MQLSQTTAVRLLTKVVATGWIDHAALATALVVRERTLAAFLSGAVVMPLDRQLCLALVVIEKIPPLAREARRLQDQVRAAIAFHRRATETR